MNHNFIVAFYSIETATSIITKKGVEIGDNTNCLVFDSNSKNFEANEVPITIPMAMKFLEIEFKDVSKDEQFQDIFVQNLKQSTINSIDKAVSSL